MHATSLTKVYTPFLELNGILRRGEFRQVYLTLTHAGLGNQVEPATLRITAVTGTAVTQ